MKLRDIKINRQTWYISVLEYMFLFLLFLSVNSVYWQATNSHYQSFITLGILTLGLLLSVFLMFRVKKIHIQVINWLLVYYAIIIFLVLYNLGIGQINNRSIIRLLLFPIIICLFIYYDVTNNKDNNTIPYKIVNIGVSLAIVSVALWSLRLIGINTNSSIQILWGGVRNVPGLFRLQFFPQGSVSFFGISILRNSGFYSEAPMFSFVLSFSLIMHLFCNKRASITDFRTVILGITLITTTSTTGLLILVISILFKLNIQSTSLWKIITIVMIPIGIIILEYILTAKVSDMGGSVDTRIDDIRIGLLSWKRHLILGNGIDNSNSIKQFMDYSRLGLYGNHGFSSGVFNILSGGGLLLASIFIVIPFVKFSHNSLNNTAFCICFITLLSVSIVDSTYFVLFIIIYMYIFSSVEVLHNK